MFNELQHILASFGSYDFESQVILNRNVIIKAYIKVKNLREKHGFDIDFEESFWKASDILSNYGIMLPRFNTPVKDNVKQDMKTQFNSVSA